MEAIKSLLKRFKTRTDLGELGCPLMASSIATTILTVIGGIHTYFMVIGYGFNQSPGKELTPCSVVIVLTTLVTSVVTLMATRRFCVLTIGSIALVQFVELLFSIFGLVFGFVVLWTQGCHSTTNLVSLPMPWMKPTEVPRCQSKGSNISTYLLAALVFIWFLQILIVLKILLGNLRHEWRSRKEEEYKPVAEV